LLQLAVMEATFIALATVNAVGYALAADTLRGRIRKPAVLTAINRVGAACLVGLGAVTVTISRT